MLKTFFLLIIGAGALLLVMRGGALGAPVRAAAVRPTAVVAQGTVARTTRIGNATHLLLRSGGTALHDELISPAYQVFTRDGWALAADAVLPGDRVQVLHDDALVDLSQHAVDATGIVSSVSVPGAPLIVTIGGNSSSIVVDTGSVTAFRDTSRQASNIGDLEDADMIEVRGILDDASGEMTRTDSIQRLGPRRRS